MLGEVVDVALAFSRDRIVVNKKTAFAEMGSARNSCKSSVARTPQAVPAAAPQAVPVPAVIPVPNPTAQATQSHASTDFQVPVKAGARLCVASTIEANGRETRSRTQSNSALMYVW